MASCSDKGQELFQHLQNLNITTGNLNAEDFATWFDTDNTDTQDFLNWFTTCVGPENVLTAQERKCYDRISENLVLSEDKFNELTAELENEYPGIFDVESNELEILCLEEELKIRRDELKRLNKQNVTNGEVNKILKKDLSKYHEREAVAKHRVDQAERKCLEKTDELKNSKAELQKQIRKYGNKLANFSDEVLPSSLSNMDVQAHNEYVKNVGDNLKRAIEKNHELDRGTSVKKKWTESRVSSLSSTQKINKISISKSTADATFDEQTEVMQKRLEKAYLDNINAKVRQDELQHIHDFLIDLKIIDLPVNYERSDIFESLMNAKAEEMFAIKADIQKVVSQVVRQQIETQKYPVLQNEIDTYQEKLDFVKSVNENMDEVLSYMFLLYMLLEQERQDIKSTEKFFHDIYQYITHNHYNQSVRTQAMLDITKRRKEEPFAEKFHLVSLILTTITGKETVVENLSEAVKIVQAFTSECKSLEMKIFCDDILNFRKDAQIILKNMNSLKKYLTNGPTSEYAIIPHRVYTLYTEIKDVQSRQEYMLKSYLQLKQSVKDKLSKNKWLKYRRQLWMYFLESPGHVHAFIQYIQQEVEKNIKAGFA